jgi:hypothetical protein
MQSLSKKTHRSRAIARTLAAVCVAFVCSLPAQAQLLAQEQLLAQGRGPQLTVEPIEIVTVVRGGSARLTIPLRVNRGYHVNSHLPSEEFLVPTVVHLNPQEGIMIVKITYPEGETMKFSFAGKDSLSVYSGSFEVTAEVRASHGAGLGRQRVHGEVRYQACDDRQCFPPRSTPFHFDVRVVRSKASHH